MNKLKHYSTINNLAQYIETFCMLMENPYSEHSQEQLRPLFTSLLPFYIFENPHTDNHTRLLDLVRDNIAVGNIDLNTIRGQSDVNHFFQTLANTTNLQALELLYPLAVVVQNNCNTSPHHKDLERISDQLAKIQHCKITQTLESTDATTTFKRKI